MTKHYKITAPDRAYSGSVGGVGFHRGVARVEADGLAAELAYFARKGYVVELVEEAPVKPVADAVKDEGVKDDVAKAAAKSAVKPTGRN